MKTGKRCKIGKKHKKNRKNQIRRSWRRAERITSKQHGKQKEKNYSNWKHSIVLFYKKNSPSTTYHRQ